MKFNDNSKLAGLHAKLSPSSNAWLNYSDDKFDRVFHSKMAAQRGTDLHDLAQRAIKLRQPFPDTPTTMNLYVNDCIGYRMTPELVLVYSRNCFGTADALAFRRNILKISDLKTGSLKVGVKQLEVYAALFCLEYGLRPQDLERIELRIYQNDAVELYEANPVDINLIMARIVELDKRIEELREEAE